MYLQCENETALLNHIKNIWLTNLVLNIKFTWQIIRLKSANKSMRDIKMDTSGEERGREETSGEKRGREE